MAEFGFCGERRGGCKVEGAIILTCKYERRPGIPGQRSIFLPYLDFTAFLILYINGLCTRLDVSILKIISISPDIGMAVQHLNRRQKCHFQASPDKRENAHFAKPVFIPA